MATATPEEFPREGGFPETPFSPSLFLDLPPTPIAQDDRAASDDLDLEYISTMLMEDDIDGKFFYEYPDHPALLRAQQPYAQIISDAISADSPPDTNSNSTGFSTSSTGFATNSNSTGTGFPTSSSDDTNNSPTWPYDPIELSKLLQSPSYLDATRAGPAPDFHADDDDNNLFIPGDAALGAFGFPRNSALFNGGGTAGFFNSAEEAAAISAGNGAHGVRSFFDGQTDGNMDMLNMAFLKGMEEAKKFLPTNNGILIDLDATSDKQLPSEGVPELGGFTSGGRVKEAVNGTPLLFPNGRGRKNRHDADDLEAETGRSSKLMMPEQEETSARELFDEMILNGHEMLLKGMKDLRIAMSSDAEKNIRKVSRGRRGGESEVVDLRTMLVHCAQAVATGDRRSATELLKQIKQHSNASGDATQRLAHCFAEGLEARLAGTGSSIYQSLVSRRTSVVELLKAYMLFIAVCPFKKASFLFAAKTILDAVQGKSRVHIVDYGVQHGFQWPGLLWYLSNREGGPPEVRMTGIDLPQPGFRPAYRIEETGRRLSRVAREFSLPFKFHAVAAKWESVRAEDLNLDPDEALVVNTQGGFGKMMDEGVTADGASPRDVLLSNIREMRPHVFVMCVSNGTYGAPFFATRFREAMFFYSAHFDMLDTTTPRDNDVRLLIERDIFGRGALNIIACEGADRVDRPETYKQWQVRNHRAGLRQLQLNQEAVKAVTDKVKNNYHKDFLVDVDRRWLLQGWKGRVLWAMSAWVADDDNSLS